MFAASVSVTSPGRRLWLLSASSAVAVGHDEESLALVGRRDVLCLDERFLDAVANAFEVWLNNVEVSESKVSAHVFKEAPLGSGLLNVSEDVRPDVARVVGAEPLAGD